MDVFDRLASIIPFAKDFPVHERVIEYDWRQKRKDIANEVRARCLGNSTVNKNKRKNKRVTSKNKKRR